MSGERYKNKYPFQAMNEPYQTRMRGELSDTDAMHAPRMYVSPTAPSVNNDNRDADGIQTVFQRSDFWWESTNDRIYICADPTNTAAQWELINGIGGYPVDNTNLDQGSYPWFDTASASFIYDSRWDDENGPITSVKLRGVNDPTWAKIADNGAGSTGVYAYKFNEAAEQEVFLWLQYHHGRNVAKDFDIHVHWMTTSADTGAVVWGAEYLTFNIGDTIGVTTIATVTAHPEGSQVEQLTSIADITAAALPNISGLMGIRLFRNATSAADTYDTGAVLLFIDSHYQHNKYGSTNELSN